MHECQRYGCGGEYRIGYQSKQLVPSFADADTKQIVMDHLPFWKIAKSQVHSHGPFPPLRLFKHGAQSLYSKTKGVVDGATQFGAILRAPTRALRWEQKLVFQTLKTVVVNVFVGWQILTRSDVLESAETFRSLHRYRTILNKLQSFGDFVFDLPIQLLRHASRVVNNDEHLEVEVDATKPSAEEASRLLELARKKQRNSTAFFEFCGWLAPRPSASTAKRHQEKQTLCSLC